MRRFVIGIVGVDPVGQQSSGTPAGQLREADLSPKRLLQACVEHVFVVSGRGVVALDPLFSPSLADSIGTMLRYSVVCRYVDLAAEMYKLHQDCHLVHGDLSEYNTLSVTRTSGFDYLVHVFRPHVSLSLISQFECCFGTLQQVLQKESVGD